jgi:hypothetical protein
VANTKTLQDQRSKKDIEWFNSGVRKILKTTTAALLTFAILFAIASLVWGKLYLTLAGYCAVFGLVAAFVLGLADHGGPKS